MYVRWILLLLVSESAFGSANRLYEKFKEKVSLSNKEKSLCPMAWQYFAASCYWKFPIRRSWNEAREECARFRADLVVIDSDKEFDYIAKNVSDLREDFYVGFHYVNSSWSWINNRALSDYTYYTEEDLCEDRLPIEPRHRSCGILDRARRGRLCMNVDVCDRKLNFICEKVVDRCSSLNDVCGKHGRCINTDDGQFRCECHFLFSGTRCRSISQEGSQIILATIFVLVACFTPILFRSIYRILKRKFNRSATIYDQRQCLNNHSKVKNRSKKTDEWKTLLEMINRMTSKNLCHSPSFLLGLSTFLLTGFCLMTIPFIQQRVNNSNQTVNSTIELYQRCRHFDHYVWQNFVALPLAIVITLICSFLKRRDTFCLQFCHGRPSLPMPLNLFDKRQRHVIAAIFGISANEVLRILEEVLFRLQGKSLVSDEGIIVELLKRVGIVLLIGMRYFPLLISVNIAHPISYGLGLFYTLIDGSYTLIYAGYCSRFGLLRFSRTLLLQTSLKEQDFVYVILRNLPHFTFISFVFVKFTLLFIEQIQKRCKSNSTIVIHHHDKIRQVSLVSSTLSTEISVPDYQTKPEFFYTEALLKSQAISDMYYDNLLTRPFSRFYRWHRYFTYSIQVLCTYTVALTVVYNLTCLFTFYGIHSIKSQLDRIHLLILHQFNWEIDWGTNLINDLVFCSILAVLIYSVQIINGLIKIQQHLLAGYAGKYLDIPPRHNFSNNELISKCLHFSGYLCGYTAWGFIIFSKVSFLFCLFIRLWIRYDARWFQHILALSLPIVLVYLLKHILISLLAEFVFLQNFARTPSLNNRRIFFIFNYFNFFFDCFLGILSCVIRASKSLLASLVFMGRLDYSFMGRSLERLDQGYATYVTFIHMEILHGHPILVTFCDMIWNDIERKRRINEQSKNSKLIYDTILQTKVHSARFRWHLAYTLLRNEYLKFVRKHALNRPIEFPSSSCSLTSKSAVHRAETNNNETNQSSILLYDRAGITQPSKRSGYRYNFDYEQTNDLRLIYQQLKSLTNNVSSLKNQSRAEDVHPIYLSPSSHFTSPTIDDRKFSQMPTMQRR